MAAARTYELALAHLAALQSNRAITSLFAAPPAPPTIPASASAKDKPQDLNALAIPEMLAWLRRAGIERDAIAQRLRCIHVAGTKGKGSVCAYLTALLVAQGRDDGTGGGEGEGIGGGGKGGQVGKVGTYTSPHLVSVRERIAIDGAPISRTLFARYFFEVWDACTAAARAELVASRTTTTTTGEKGPEAEAGLLTEDEEAQLRGPLTKPFYFRFLTLVALRAFLGEGVRSAVIECGIGGEYDATNILPVASVTASVISQLGIDHVGMLGPTLPEIAWHKAGVCKSGRRCFTRRLPANEDTMTVLRARAQGNGAMLVEVDDVDVEAWGGLQRDASVGVGASTGGSLEGAFQKYNQALAVLAAREHIHVLAREATGNENNEAIPIDENLHDIPQTFTSALQHARLRGRCETREDSTAPVTWLIDGAHTAESLTEVAKWFAGKLGSESNDSEAILVFNQQDRDASKLVGGLLADIKAAVGSERERIFAHAIFTRNDLTPRAVSDEEPERDLTAQTAAAETLRAAASDTATSVWDNVADAVAEARALASQRGHGKRTTVLVTGSLHLVGALLRTLEPEAED